MARVPQYVYVGDLLQALGQKRTGIPRVEWEVARRLIADGAIPFTFSLRFERFMRVTDWALDVLDRLQNFEFNELMNSPSTGGRVVSRTLGRLAATAYPHMTHDLGLHWNTERLALHLFARNFHAMPAVERHEILRRLGVTRYSPLEGKVLTRLLKFSDPSVNTTLLAGPMEFAPGAMVVNCGIWWSESAVAQMKRFRQELGLRYVGLIYDLSPIRRPADFGDRLSAAFRTFVDGSLSYADALMPISRYVADDLATYAGETGARLPTVTTFRLAPGLTAGATTTLSPRFVRAGLPNRPFVPFISAINPRKGHIYSYDLWVKAIEALNGQAPALVWAGQLGTPEGDARAIASRDSRMWDRHIHYFEGPTDAEVAWLYENAAYTIYPSTFEGWGLPISESLAFGKYCLAADNTSLPEAGEGLAFHAPAADTESWLSEVKRLALDPGYLKAMTARVVANYRPRTWDDTAREVADCVATVSA